MNRGCAHQRLVHTLVQHGLVDQYRLMVFPIILGRGKRLFPDEVKETAKLTLTESKTAGEGLLLLTYQAAPATAPAAGQPDAAA